MTQHLANIEQFEALQANQHARMGMSPIGVFNDAGIAQNQQVVSVHNFYGHWETPSDSTLEQITISIDAQEIENAIIGRNKQESGTWEWLKTQPFEIVTRIGVIAKDEVGGGRQTTIASYNTNTRELSVDGNTIVTFPEKQTPIDGVISALGGSDTQLVPAAEKVIWKYVNSNPGQFIGGQSNG